MKLVRLLARSIAVLLATTAGAEGATGVFRQMPLPSPGSGPTSILYTGIGILFAEYDANKIGFLTRDGRLIEYSIPTPNSGPMDLDFSFQAGQPLIWFTEFLGNKIGRLNPHTGEFREYPIPTPASGPHSIIAGEYPLQVWFTEFHGNKIARLTADGQFTEFEVPTPDSGPMGISWGFSGTVWFTELVAGKLGNIRVSGGPITELLLPTASSGPADIGRYRDGRMVFTEFHAGKIGLVGYDRETITEIPLPTPTGGPFRLCESLLSTGEVWFTERLANKMGVIRFDYGTTQYRATEFEIPTGRSEPYGCTFTGFEIWFTERAGNALSSVRPDSVVFLGAGNADGWETTFRYSNSETSPTLLYTGYFYEPPYVCPGSCLWYRAPSLPARGTAEHAGGPGLAVVNSRPLDRGELPTVDARARWSAQPGRATSLPGTRLSTVSRLDPSVLVFPGAIRSTGARSNLSIANLSLHGDLELRTDVFTSEGVLVGSEAFTLPRAEYYAVWRPFTGVLSRLGISELRNGQIRVTKTGGEGLLWGTLTTLAGDAVLTDVGRNLSLPAENASGGDPLVVLGGLIGSWETELDIGNARDEPLDGTIGIVSCSAGASCPPTQFPFTVPPNGTVTLSSRGLAGLPEGLHAFELRFAGAGTQPTVRPRTVNRARASQTAVLPALHLSAIHRLGTAPLSFPGAARSESGARSNLILTETGSGDAVALVQVFSSSGAVLKASFVEIAKGTTLFLQDLLAGAGSELENAHVLVTKTGGHGNLWGILATFDRHQALSIGLGVHP